MHPFPVALDLAGREVLVVGSDEDAVRRVEKLIAAGARVRVLVRGEVPEALRRLEAAGSLHLEARRAREEDLDGVALAYVATSEEDQAPALHARALHTGQLVCTIDRPELCTFINPAVVDLGALVLTVSTGGASPALARRIREDLEALFSEPRFLAWLETMRRERAEVPRGERAARGLEQVRGFAVQGRLVLPDSIE
jgi:precorrin-2 dehydrogenase/sirohydrochlorin ferrochelatase